MCQKQLITHAKFILGIRLRHLQKRSLRKRQLFSLCKRPLNIVSLLGAFR